MQQFRLDDYCSVVTGAATGLGKAMARALAQAGSHLVIADIDGEAAERSAQELRAQGTEAMAVQANVTREEDVLRLTTQARERFGRIDVLINNAGIVRHEKAELMSYRDWLDVMDVNLNAVFLMCQAVGSVMIGQRSGSIINISSMSGIISNTPQCQVAYNASKAGVIALTKSLAGEWAEHGVRVNTIAPGYMKTELTKKFFDQGGEMIERWMGMTPMRRPGEPEELGGIAVYLASPASSFATGGVFVIDGGYTAW